MRRQLITFLLLASAVAVHGQTPAPSASPADEPNGLSLLQRATAAAGGERWAQVRSLMLSGRTVFWGPTGAAPRSVAESYTLWRVFDPDRSASRLTDPQGGVSLFGIDPQSYAIRSLGFSTPRGWHERHYSDFVRQDNPPWLQAREVTLYYNGVKASSLFWERWVIDEPIANRLIAPPALFPPPAIPR